MQSLISMPESIWMINNRFVALKMKVHRTILNEFQQNCLSIGVEQNWLKFQIQHAEVRDDAWHR